MQEITVTENRSEKPPDISVVVPVFNSAGCLRELVQRVSVAMNQAGRRYELILVNDGSTDTSWEEIQKLCKGNTSIMGMTLRRNFGQDNALMAGIAYSSGPVVVIMDDDLQHDPGDIDRLVAKVEEGFDVCYARFSEKQQVWWKNAGSWLNDRMANLFLGKPRGVYLSPFKAIDRDVVQEIVHYDGPFPYVDGLIFRVTRNITQIDANHHTRFAGRSNYNLVRSIAVFLKLATSFSVVPLRLAMYMGFSFAALGLVLAVLFVAIKLVSPNTPMGWASTITTILVLGGVQLACAGIMGEYLGRTYIHLNKQPQYVVKKVVGDAFRPHRQSGAATSLH